MVQYQAAGATDSESWQEVASDGREIVDPEEIYGSSVRSSPSTDSILIMWVYWWFLMTV